jgi:hypothetical protein
MNIVHKIIWTIVTIACISLLFVGEVVPDSLKPFLFCLGVISCLNISLIDFYASIYLPAFDYSSGLGDFFY